MTAPKNMPTGVLERMVINAYQHRAEWERDVTYLETRLASAKSMVEHFTKEHAKLLADLIEREAEEAK